MIVVNRLASLWLLCGAAFALGACSGGSSSLSAPAVASIEVSPNSIALVAGQTDQVTVTATYTTGAKAGIASGETFTSSDPAVAAVSVTATDPGSGKVSGAVTVTVSAAQPASITVTPSSASLLPGASQALTVTAQFAASSTPITSGLAFTSSNLNIATVSATGVVTAVGPGSATITVTDAAANQTASATISVLIPVTLTSIAVTPATASLAAGARETLNVAANYSDGSQKSLSTGLVFTSSNSAVATVTAAGVVTAVAPGSATITVTDTAANKTASATVTVPVPLTLTSISVAPATSSLVAGSTETLSVTANFSDGSHVVLNSGLGFASSNAAVATVNGAGLVSAVAAGTATLTATDTANGLTATAQLTVTPIAAVTLTSIAVAPTAATLAPAATQALTVTGTYSNGTSAVLTTGNTFVSSNSAFATVTGVGLVTAVASGTATITVTNTATGLTASATITVASVTTVVGGNVYSNGALDTGVAFHLFGGALNVPAPAPDPSTPFTDGTAGLKVVITGTTGAYSGGAWVASATRDLRAANAVTFWAKASTPKSSLKIQIGNDAGAGANVNYQVESIGIALTTGWQQYVLPLPDPTKAVGFDGLFSFADGPNNYTLWFADIQYVNLPGNVLGSLAATNPVKVTWPTPSLPVGSANAYTIPFGPNVVNWSGTVPPLPNAGVLDNVTFRWFTLTSSNPAVATVSPDGVVTGISIGTATITATLAGVAVPGEATVTVTGVPTTPTTYAATPTLPASSVTALFDSSGVYTPHPVDSFGRLFCSNSRLVDPYAIPGGTGVLQYTLNLCVGITFGDGESGNTNNTVDASAYTTFHVDLWSPNPDALQIQLVNAADAASGTKSVGTYNAGTIASGQWVSLDIPFSSFTFTNGNAENALQQLLFISGTSTMILYVDNMYFH